MRYVDGFVIPVPTKNLPTYRRMARLAGKVWREHGALDYREFVADLLPAGREAQARRDGYILVDRLQVTCHRDRVNAKVMKDPRLAHMMDPKTMPFDGKRMIFGGFKKLISA